MSGISNSTGAKSGIIGTTVGTPAGGITEADTWRLTENFLNDLVPISDNLERDDTYGSAVLGTGMTLENHNIPAATSDGIFAFPSTGWWQIFAQLDSQATLDSYYQNIKILVTTDNSTYNWAAGGHNNLFAGTTPSYANATAVYILKVTSISTHKVQFGVDNYSNASNTRTMASSTNNLTYFTFMKLAEL